MLYLQPTSWGDDRGSRLIDRLNAVDLHFLCDEVCAPGLLLPLASIRAMRPSMRNGDETMRQKAEGLSSNKGDRS